jgi:hypothetical protein
MNNLRILISKMEVENEPFGKLITLGAIQEEVDKLKNFIKEDQMSTHNRYEIISHFKVSLTITNDETPTVLNETKSIGVVFATSKEDALAQTKTGN